MPVKPTDILATAKGNWGKQNLCKSTRKICNIFCFNSNTFEI